MTSSQVIEALHKGATLCMEHTPEGKVWWLEPRRIIIRSDVAERVVGVPGIVAGGDRLFKDETSQTWKAAS